MVSVTCGGPLEDSRLRGVPNDSTLSPAARRCRHASRNRVAVTLAGVAVSTFGVGLVVLPWTLRARAASSSKSGRVLTGQA